MRNPVTTSLTSVLLACVVVASCGSPVRTVRAEAPPATAPAPTPPPTAVSTTGATSPAAVVATVGSEGPGSLPKECEAGAESSMQVLKTGRTPRGDEWVVEAWQTPVGTPGLTIRLGKERIGRLCNTLSSWDAHAKLGNLDGLVVMTPDLSLVVVELPSDAIAPTATDIAVSSQRGFAGRQLAVIDAAPGLVKSRSGQASKLLAMPSVAPLVQSGDSITAGVVVTPQEVRSALAAVAG